MKRTFNEETEGREEGGGSGQERKKKKKKKKEKDGVRRDSFPDSLMVSMCEA